MTDVYTPYETGLRALLARLGPNHPRYDDALVYQQRLTENVAAARRYGDTEARRAGRAEIVDRLNALAQQALGLSYNALCQSAHDDDERHRAAPPLGEAAPVTQVNTGGGAYVAGNVVVQGGDFVGRDKLAEPRRPAPAARPTVPAEGEPLALLAAALEARRLLLVWADVPFPPQERPTGPAALVINRWREAASRLPGTPFDFAHGRPWPLTGLPPLTILSLDPGDRLERAFRYGGEPLDVVCTRADLPARERHTLLKLAGDLKSRTGLLLAWDDVRQASDHPDKAHLLREAGRVAQDGAVLALAPSPDDAVARMWRELVAPAVRGARHHVALGPAGFAWPEPLTRLDGEVEEVLSALAHMVPPPPLEAAEDGASELDSSCERPK